MVRHFIERTTSSVTAAAVLLASSALASRLLGMLRDRVLAGTFGAGHALDVYYAAFKIPDALYNLIILGTLSAGFIPVFARTLKRAAPSERLEVGEASWDVASGVLLLLGALLVLGSIGIIIAAPVIAPTIAPGFTHEKRELLIAITRVMAISPLLLGLSGIFGAVLQSLRRYVAFSLAPLAYNMGIIVATVLGASRYGVWAPVVGVLVGALGHFLIQMFAVLRLDFRFCLVRAHLIDTRVREILTLTFPRVLALGATQINEVVINAIASTLGAGAVAVFEFSDNLQSFPVAMIGVSLGVALFPALAALDLHKERERFISDVVGAVRQVLFLLVPMTVLFIELRAQIVRVVLGTGLFDWRDTILVATTLGFFSFSFVAQGLVQILARALYALHNTWLPFLASVIAVGTNLVFGLTLGRSALGVTGLGLGFSISAVLQVMVLWLSLRTKVGTLREGALIGMLARISIAAFAMGLVTQMSKFAVAALVGTQTFFGIATQGLFAGLAGISTYIFVAHLMKLPEVGLVLGAFRRNVLRNTTAPARLSDTEGV